MNRRNFIGAFALAPLLVKEALAVQKPSWWDYNGMNPDFMYPYEPHKMNGPGWIEFKVPMTKMNWKMEVNDIGDHTMTEFYKIFNKGVLPEFYNDQFRRSRRKNGLIKLGKARR